VRAMFKKSAYLWAVAARGEPLRTHVDGLLIRRSQVRIQLGALVHHEYTTAVRYGSVHSGTGKTGSTYLCGFVNSNERC
jgi:hypothetical protein